MHGKSPPIFDCFCRKERHWQEKQNASILEHIFIRKLNLPENCKPCLTKAYETNAKGRLPFCVLYECPREMSIITVDLAAQNFWLNFQEIRGSDLTLRTVTSAVEIRRQLQSTVEKWAL